MINNLHEIKAASMDERAHFSTRFFLAVLLVFRRTNENGLCVVLTNDKIEVVDRSFPLFPLAENEASLLCAQRCSNIYIGDSMRIRWTCIGKQGEKEREESNERTNERTQTKWKTIIWRDLDFLMVCRTKRADGIKRKWQKACIHSDSRDTHTHMGAYVQFNQ